MSFSYLTYCDNGYNIGGDSGYIYITNALKNICNLPNPIKFKKSYSFGFFDCIIDNNQYEIDIFALYAAQLYLAKLIPDTLIPMIQTELIKYIGLLKTRNIDKEFFLAENDIRVFGINYFTEHNKKYKSKKQPFEIADIPSLQNQKATHKIKCYDFCNAEIPLMITRKKIPLNKEDDVTTISTKWGFVTNLIITDTPVPVCSSKKHYTLYKIPIKKIISKQKDIT